MVEGGGKSTKNMIPTDIVKIVMNYIDNINLLFCPSAHSVAFRTSALVDKSVLHLQRFFIFLHSNSISLNQNSPFPSPSSPDEHTVLLCL